MAHDDFRYTLSPESIFVKSDPPPKTLSIRIEEFYLGLLRFFILIVLAMSLIGALVQGYKAFSNLREDALPYTRPLQGSPADQFLGQVKREVADPARPSSQPGAGPEQRSSEAKGEALEGQLNRQVLIVNDFLVPLARSITSPAAFKDRQRMLTEELTGPGSVANPLAYARNQTEFLERVLKDKSTVEHVRQKVEQSPAYLDEFMSKMLDYYPNLVREERKARLTFEHEESVRVAGVRANSMLHLYAAAGLFLAFLVICLILVLIKIERNLRTRGDVIQVVSSE